jgi:hypothetical protein
MKRQRGTRAIGERIDGLSQAAGERDHQGGRPKAHNRGGKNTTKATAANQRESRQAASRLIRRWWDPDAQGRFLASRDQALQAAARREGVALLAI